MKQTNGTPTILTAGKGKKLTQADENIELTDRIVTDRVYLAVNDTAERWKEITDEEAAQIAEAQAAESRVKSEE